MAHHASFPHRMDVPGRHNGQPDRERMAGGEIGNVVGGGAMWRVDEKKQDKDYSPLTYTSALQFRYHGQLMRI